MISACSGTPEAPTVEEEEEGKNFVLEGETIADAELYAAAMKEGSILVYDIAGINTAERFYKAFTEDTGIAVEIVTMPSAPLLERTLTEVGAGVFKADILGTSDHSIIKKYRDNKLWTPHKVPTFDDLEPQLVDRDGYSYSFPYPISILYNTELVKKAPTSWAALTDPEFAGRNGVLPAGLGGSSFALAMFQRMELGKDFWKRHAANKPVFFEGDTPLVESIARGELLIGVGRTGPLRDYIKAGAPLAAAYPKEGLPTAAATYGLSSHAENPNAAKLFMNWLLSERGGEIYQSTYMIYSPNTKLDPPFDEETGVKAPPRDLLWFPKPDDVVKLRADWVAEWNAIMGVAG